MARVKVSRGRIGIWIPRICGWSRKQSAAVSAEVGRANLAEAAATTHQDFGWESLVRVARGPSIVGGTDALEVVRGARLVGLFGRGPDFAEQLARDRARSAARDCTIVGRALVLSDNDLHINIAV